MERGNRTNLYCPGCGQRAVYETGQTAFLEIGEWDGRSYEREANHRPMYTCPTCGLEFVTLDDPRGER